MDRAEDRLALIEWVGPDHRATRSADVRGWPVTVGRALSNTLVLDDPAVAAEHARLDVDAQGAVTVTAGATRNGLLVGRRVLRSGESLTWPPGEERLVRLGDTTLRVRCPGDALAGEAAMGARGWQLSGPVTLALIVGWLALLTGVFWIRLDPGAEITDWLPLAAGAPLALVLWCLLWALASKVFRHHFDLGGHFGVAAPALLAVSMLDVLAPQVAASLGWPWLAEAGRWLGWGIGALWLRQHLLITLPHAGARATRVLNRSMLAGVLLVAAVYLGVHHRYAQRWRTDLYLGTLPMPSLRLHRAVPVEQFIESAGRLQQGLDAKAAADRDQEADDEP